MTRPTHPVTELLAPIDGQRIPGGCDHCNAYQVLTLHKWGPNAHAMTTHHDGWCPWLAEQQRRQSP
jgi:hypothetical protein